MTIHSKWFVGRLIEKPDRVGPRKYGFTRLCFPIDDASLGHVTVNAMLDPETLRTGVNKEALKWNTGDLVEIDGELIRTKKCDCCDNPILIVGALKCERITGSA